MENIFLYSNQAICIQFSVWDKAAKESVNFFSRWYKPVLFLWREARRKLCRLTLEICLESFHIALCYVDSHFFCGNLHILRKNAVE